MADQPLWEAMHDAAMAHVAIHGHDTPGILAAMLRVVADTAVPQEDCPEGADLIPKAIWLAQRQIRFRLLDEADCAVMEGQAMEDEAGTENIQPMEESTNA